MKVCSSPVLITILSEARGITGSKLLFSIFEKKSGFSGKGRQLLMLHLIGSMAYRILRSVINASWRIFQYALVSQIKA